MSESTSRQPRTRRVLSLTNVVAFAFGLIIGLPVLGWWLWPVHWTTTPPTPLPTYTLYPTYTPYPTTTPPPTATPIPPSPTPTPGPDASVIAPTVNVLEGPGPNYRVVGQVRQAEKLHVVGQYSGCSWLQVETSAQVTGWISSENGTVQLQKPCESIPHGIFRPLSGVLKASSRIGEGQLSAENDASSDAAVILVESGGSSAAFAAAYIRSGETYVLGNIPDGTYYLYFATGSHWDGESSRFTETTKTQRFRDSFAYTTTSFTSTIWSITLEPVVGGNARADDVTLDKFPTIK